MIKEQFTDLFLPYPDHGDRLVRVFVPEHEENETLPVIYMTDGQNLFDEKTAVWGCWKMLLLEYSMIHTFATASSPRKASEKLSVPKNCPISQLLRVRFLTDSSSIPSCRLWKKNSP